MANWPVMYEFGSKYHLPIGNSNLPKNRSETSYLLNKLDVLFEMPVNGRYHSLQVQYLAYSTRYFAEVKMSFMARVSHLVCCWWKLQ